MKISVFYDHLRDAAEQTGKEIGEILKEVAKEGIQGIEINFTCLLENETLIQDMLEKTGIQISCIYEFSDWGEKKELSYAKKQVDMAKKVGAKQILVIPGFLSEKEAIEIKNAGKSKELLYEYMNQNPKIQQMREALQELVEYADRQDVYVTLEDFDSENAPFATIYQLSWFMEHVEGLRFTMDTGNFVFSDEDAYEGFQLLKKYMVHMHCKDRGEERLENNFLYKKGMASCPTGAGYLPIKRIVKEALMEQYGGFFAIEHFGAENQLQCMKKSAQFLQELEALPGALK